MAAEDGVQSVSRRKHFPLADGACACAIQYVGMRKRRSGAMAGNPSHDDSSRGKRHDEMATKRESRERQNGRKYGEEAIAQNQLEAWPNPNPERDYMIHLEIPEFTCLCPRSGYPDFATIVIDYVPEGAIVELKSLKLYINGYR